MKKLKTLNIKKTIIILLILILHILTAFLAVQGYKAYQSKGLEREVGRLIDDGVIDKNQLAGAVFEYDLEYTLANDDIKNISGKETYYWNGNKFVLVSDFMK